jgi:hypothetical protein
MKTVIDRFVIRGKMSSIVVAGEGPAWQTE